jgi:phosphoribosyl-ATP pyrophosphohydrolase
MGATFFAIAVRRITAVCASGDKSKVFHECAELWFHLMVMLAQFDLSLQDVLNEVAQWECVSGIEEKASRK